MAKQPTVYVGGREYTQADIDDLAPSAMKEAAQEALNAVRGDQKKQDQYHEQMSKAKTVDKVDEIEARAEAAHQKALDQIALQEAKAEAAERQERAKTERKKEESRISRKNAGARRATNIHHEAIPVTRPSLTSTSLLPQSPETRFLDLGLSMVLGGGSAWYTVTRPTAGARLGWGAFFTGLGILAGVEAKGSTLKYGGIGTATSNGTALLFEALQLMKK